MSLMFALSAFAQTSRPASGPGLLETTVVERHSEQDMVALALGREAGVGVSDAFWVFDQSLSTTPRKLGAEFITPRKAPGRLARGLGAAETISAPYLRGGVLSCASGHVFLVTPTACVGRLTGPVGRVAAGASVVIVQGRSLLAGRAALPEGVTLRGRLLRLPPGRRTAWLDLGRRAGLRLGDSLLVGRNGIPIARGRVSLLEDETALATLRPLVGNTLPQPGDAVGFWPAPCQRRWGRVDSAVLDVRPDPEGPLVTLVGTAADGLREGRLVDLFRNENYVGLAVLVELSDPLSVARVIESASAQMPEVGDRAVVRSGPGPPVYSLAAAVFRVVEGGYCLLAAGESDGVRIGEKFIVRRPNLDVSARPREVAELTVRTVKEHHCGCDVRLLGDLETRLMPWDWAERQVPPWPRWTPIGVVNQVDEIARSAVADIDAGSSLTRGQVVRWVPPVKGDQAANACDRLPGAAIVLHVTSMQALLYIPPGWGDIEHLNSARVEARMSDRGEK